MKNKTQRIMLAVLIMVLSAHNLYAAWIGDAAPSFSLSKMESDSTVSLAELKGKVVFIDFWASWCGPCKKELPALNEFYKRQDPNKVVVLAINLDKKLSNAQKFIQKVPVELTILLDAESHVVKQFGARAMPTSFIIDAEGVIRYVHLGYTKHDPGKWEKEISELLNLGTQGAKL